MNTSHVLIIDDNEDNLQVLAGLLAQQGITYTAVKDPTRVMGTLEQMQQLNAIFCDLEMPKMDGFQLLDNMRQYVGNQVPIIAYTVHLSEMDTARQIGFDGFLGKPIDAERFPMLIKRILNRQPVWELP